MIKICLEIQSNIEERLVHISRIEALKTTKILALKWNEIILENYGMTFFPSLSFNFVPFGNSSFKTLQSKVKLVLHRIL